jgi:hypothetical protein
MPIIRTFCCPECAHTLEVTLRADQWDNPPPICPRCNAWDFEHKMQQEFKPFSIGGSARAQAVKLAENIMEKDYNVADAKIEGYEGVRNKVRYKDQSMPGASSWGAANAALEQAVATGRQNRIQHGSSLDVIKQMPDLIELSKRRSLRGY